MEVFDRVLRSGYRSFVLTYICTAARFHCGICDKNMTMEARIKCVDCQDNFDLCLSCFCSGKSKGEHLPTHGYRVAGMVSFPLFSEKVRHVMDTLRCDESNDCISVQLTMCMMCMM